MLVLSRKPGESIHIGTDVEVTVLEVSGKLVRIGISAPEHINILRSEVKEQIEKENTDAEVGHEYMDRIRKIGSILKLKREK
jgi:carbon storage regulator